MTDFDPTTNRIPFGLLTPEEQAVLKAWPHGWQVSGGDGYWVDMHHHPTWAIGLTYRGKPAPVKVAYEDEAALYELKHIYTRAEVQHLLGNRPTWEQWKELLAAGYKQKARADRLEATLRENADKLADEALQIADAMADATEITREDIANVTKFPYPQEMTTVDEALRDAAEAELTDVLVLGYSPDGQLYIRSSGDVAHKDALFMLEHGRMAVLKLGIYAE